MARITRRRFLQGTLAAGAAAALPGIADASLDPAKDEHVVFSVPGLDPAHDGLRLAQLSDLHVGNKTPDAVLRAAIDDVNRFEPELVVLTGDFLSYKKSEVERARAVLGGIAAPTVAVLGNHDVWVDPEGAADALRGHGYEVLENEWTTVRLRGAPLTVVGVGDYMTGRADVDRATKGIAASGSAPLVLAHGPRTADRLRALDRSMLCLSGHTHGGQVVLPIITPIFTRFVTREPYVRGAYQVGRVHLYVNRGIGMSGLKMRFNCPAEVTLATLRVAEPGPT
jgi:predicted MPP superfamily phosphohydrolase